MTKKKIKIPPGWNEQIKRSKLETPRLTVKEVETKLKAVFEESLEENAIRVSPWPIGYVGHGMYHIGDGAFTGKKGWEIFTEMLMEETSNFENKDEFLK